MWNKKNIRDYFLPIMSLLLMMAGLYMVFVYVPTEKEMGVVQRIFYFHVPIAWISYLAFFVAFVSSILYLWKNERKWDSLAYSSIEIGLIFTTLVLVTGPIWAKSAWGAWWTWDARLTTTLILWIIYIAYLTIRSFASNESQGARFAAIVGIVGFLDVPISAFAINLWETQHPQPLIFEGGLESSMQYTLFVCLAAFTVAYVTLLITRFSLRECEADILQLEDTLTESD